MEPARGRAVVDTVPYISPFTPYSICFNTIIILLYLIAAWDPTNIQWEPIENQYRKDNNYWVIWENLKKLSQIIRGLNWFRLILMTKFLKIFLWFPIIIQNYKKIHIWGLPWCCWDIWRPLNSKVPLKENWMFYSLACVVLAQAWMLWVQIELSASSLGSPPSVHSGKPRSKLQWTPTLVILAVSKLPYPEHDVSRSIIKPDVLVPSHVFSARGFNDPAVKGACHSGLASDMLLMENSLPM